MEKRFCNLIKKQFPRFKTTQKLRDLIKNTYSSARLLIPKPPLIIFYVFMYLFCLVLTNWLNVDEGELAHIYSRYIIKKMQLRSIVGCTYIRDVIMKKEESAQ